MTSVYLLFIADHVNTLVKMYVKYLGKRLFDLPAVIFGTTSPPKWGETYSDLELFGGELEGDMLIGVHLCLFVGLHIGGSKSSDRFNVAQAIFCVDVQAIVV